MQLNAVFHRKEPKFDPEPCAAEKIIELSEADYWGFRQSMLQDQPFIAEFNNTLRARGDGMTRCLLVLGEGCDDGVLIDPSGSNYARYAAFVPGARQLIAMDQLQVEQVFREQVGQIEGADPDNARAWMYHARALAEADAGTFGAAAHLDYLCYLRDFGEAFQRIDRMYEETPAEIFHGKAFCRPDQLLPMTDWISNGGDIATAMEGLHTGVFNPLNYVAANLIVDGLSHDVVHHTYADVMEAYGLSDDQMPQLYARLRDREEVGELLLYENRAAFTLCFKPEYLLDHTPAQQQEPLTQDELAVMYARHILWCYGQPDGERADFSGKSMSELDFNGMDFCNANFAGATIHQCRLSEACFDDSDFTGAKLRGVSAYQGQFNGANFSDATIEFSEFPEAQFAGADFSQAELVECDGLDDIAQGPAMTMGGM